MDDSKSSRAPKAVLLKKGLAAEAVKLGERG
jgi:hypothetical protein